MLELDLYFTNFIENGGLDSLDDKELISYLELVELDDTVVWLLLQRKKKLMQLYLQDLIDKILFFNNS